MSVATPIYLAIALFFCSAVANAQWLYWVEESVSDINLVGLARARLDGSTGPEQVLPLDVCHQAFMLEGLGNFGVFDSQGGKVYWIDGDTQGPPTRIMRSNLDGSQAEPFADASDGTKVVVLKLVRPGVAAKQWLYWTTNDAAIPGSYGLARAALGGPPVVEQVLPPILRPMSSQLATFAPDGRATLVFDTVGAKLYWSDACSWTKVMRANLDGSEVAVFYDATKDGVFAGFLKLVETGSGKVPIVGAIGLSVMVAFLLAAGVMMAKRKRVAAHGERHAC